MSNKNEYIKEKIDKNNEIIQSLLQPNQFTLNNSIAALIKENAELQKQCTHKFDKGYCIYCYKSKEEVNIDNII